MSKGLEALKEVNKYLTKYFNRALNRPEDTLVKWTEIDIVEKELKALEIIRNKKINLEYLKCCETYEQYKMVCSYWNEITKEEYDLLKEYFK